MNLEALFPATLGDGDAELLAASPEGCGPGPGGGQEGSHLAVPGAHVAPAPSGRLINEPMRPGVGG